MPENQETTDHADPTTDHIKPDSSSILQSTLYPITLKFEDVVYKVKVEDKERSCFISHSSWKSWEKPILNGISGVVFPGEILAMLGPSGSGKTTLLTALGGRLPKKFSGTITYNNQPFSGAVKRRTGFVEQDDVLYPHLTVFETLFFTALLRLPVTLTRDEKARHTERVVAELGLTRCRNSMIGGGLVRGVSGGERKRVSIGQEMLINPSLLLLDEPTSGLDSTTALRIMTVVKRLASGGRTVVTTIHQPSSRLYHMFDKVVLLSEGSPIYYGAANAALDYFNSIGFSTSITINPADLLLDLANGIGPDTKPSSDEGDNKEEEQKLVKKTLVEEYDKNTAKGLRAELCCTTTHANKASFMSTKDISHATRGEHERKWCTSWWHQFKVLMERGMRERRFEVFNRLRIFQVTSVAFLGGLLWWHTPTSHIQDRVSLIFFFSVFWGFYPLYNAVFTFPQERRMLLKERSSGMYRLSSYFLARSFGDLPLEIGLPTAFVFILYWMGGLDPRPIPFLLFLFVVLSNVLVAQGLGLAIGATVITDLKQATTLASVVTLIFLIAGGYYVQHIPPFILWLKYLSYSYYCYKLLLGVQYGPEDYYRCETEGEAVRFCRVFDFPAVRAVGVHRLWVDVGIMVLMLLGYRLLAYLMLRRRLRIIG